MLIQTKRLFQFSLVTLLTAFLFLGAMGANNAQALQFEGLGEAKFKISCWAGDGVKAEKFKEVDTAFIAFETLSHDISAIFFLDSGPIGAEMEGTILQRNDKVFDFQLYGFDENLAVFVIGKIILQDEETVKKVIYKVFATETLEGCNVRGKGKAVPGEIPL